ncbi:MAG TPA: monovalent cation/H+ antiporter complex subunit F [Labilithrix sp.]|nr:monovalent cation/H+ antiporter complex subunit F [Labilithrix sp.]
MHDFLNMLAAFLLLNVVAGLIGVARGPTLADRILVAQLFGTTAVAVLVILAEDAHAPPLRDVALVFALFASVMVIAFVRSARRPEERAGNE